MTSFARIVNLLKVQPPAARMKRKIWGARLKDMAERVVEVHGATPRLLPPAICLPGMFDRVKGFDATTNRADQDRWINSTSDENGITSRYLLRDVLLTPAGVYHSRGMLDLRHNAPKGLVLDPEMIEEESLLCSSDVIERYFGHWLRDGLDLELIAEDLGIPAVAPERPSWLHEAGYREMSRMKNCEHVRSSLLKKLWVIDDRALNEGRIERMLRLRDRLISTVGQKRLRSVFLRRGTSGVRRQLLNEEKIIATLENQGYLILEPEKSTAHEIVSALVNADVVVGVEGSAITHSLVCMRSSSVLVVIQPPFRFNAMARVYATAGGQTYGYTIADPQIDGFTQRIDELLKTIEICVTSRMIT